MVLRAQTVTVVVAMHGSTMQWHLAGCKVARQAVATYATWLWNVVSSGSVKGHRGMTWSGTILPPTGTGASTGTGTGTVPKRNHNRSPHSTRTGGEPLTTEQQQQATTLAAAGYSQTKIAKAVGRSRNAVKRYLGTEEASAIVRDERAELVEIYREKARDCVVAITDDKIARSSALQLATSSGILIDKSLLLSGHPTAINVSVLVDLLDAIRAQDDAESERQQQEAKALLSRPANQT